MLSDSHRYRWDLERIIAELGKIMRKAYRSVRAIAEEKHLDMRTAAFVLAIRRVGTAALARNHIEEEISFG